MTPAVDNDGAHRAPSGASGEVHSPSFAGPRRSSEGRHLLVTRARGRFARVEERLAIICERLGAFGAADVHRRHALIHRSHLREETAESPVDETSPEPKR